MKIIPLVCSCYDQIGEDTGKEPWKYGKEPMEGAGSATATPMCHRETVQDSKEGLDVGKEAETSARMWQYCRQQCLTWGSATFSGLPCSVECLFCPSFICSIMVLAHNSTVLQEWGFLGTEVFCPSWKTMWEQNDDSLLKRPQRPTIITRVFFSLKHLFHLEVLY